MDLKDRLQYILHYDELSWMPKVLERPFNRMKIPYVKRPLFLNWLDQYTSDQVYLWSGAITPGLGQSSWGHVAAPDEEHTFIVFESDSDQVRFALEFVGNPVGMSAHTFKDGLTAYQNRKR